MRLVGLGAALAGLACTATGCFTAPDAADLVSGETSATPVGRAAAAAALRDYIDVVNDALDTGDIAELAAMTGPRCPCRALVGLIHERYAGAAELAEPSFTADRVRVVGRRGRQARVRARISVSEYDVLNRDGLVVGRQRPQSYVATYTLRREDDTWTVVDVGQDRANGR